MTKKELIVKQQLEIERLQDEIKQREDARAEASNRTFYSLRSNGALGIPASRR